MDHIQQIHNHAENDDIPEKPNKSKPKFLRLLWYIVFILVV